MKNWKTKILSTTLALSVLVPTASFAANTVTGAGDAAAKKPFVHYQMFNQEKRQEMNDKILDLVSKYTPESLAQWKAALAEQEQLMSDLKEKRPTDKQKPQISDEVKEKIKTIYENVKSGKLTPAQAREELKNLGIEKHRVRPELSDEIKEKVGQIRQDVKSGKLTPEQAREELKNLGIEKHRVRPELSDEIKEKVGQIRQDVKSGKLTPEQAREELKNLGLKARSGFEGKGRFAQNNLKVQLMKAVKANDEAKIKELLPQMLQQLQERNQTLSNKLGKSN
ncbi:MAG: hypothetical protein H0Z40_06240 [Desulfotomaculum sp.]|nr:hypothetical protein [Desulfotomaculum sp.]